MYRNLIMRCLFFLSLCVFYGALLSGCATPPAPTPIARTGLRLPPSTLGASISVQQHLTIERPGGTHQLDTALEIDPQQLNLVGMVLGQRVMSLHYDGKTLQTWRHPQLPQNLRAEDVLEDLQLSLWPANVIRHALPAGWSLQQHGRQRILFLNHVPIVDIHYSSRLPWNGTIVFNNLRYHYRLTIQSVAAGS